jgi:hypothetical protein
MASELLMRMLKSESEAIHNMTFKYDYQTTSSYQGWEGVLLLINDVKVFVENDMASELIISYKNRERLLKYVKRIKNNKDRIVSLSYKPREIKMQLNNL